jgi:hypothetical protein
VRCEIIATGLKKQQFGIAVSLKLLQSQEVCRNVFANGSVRTATSLDGAYFVWLQRLVANEEIAVFFGEDIVCNRSQAQAIAQALAKSKHQGSLAAADGATDANRERAL